jgi:hypothetical protein
MRRPVTALLALAILAATTVALKPVRAAVLDLVAPTPAPGSTPAAAAAIVLPEPPAPGQSVPARTPVRPTTGPKLTDAQVSAAVAAIAADAGVRNLLGGADYSVADAVPWVTPGSVTPSVVGADVEITLTKALNGPVALPGIRFDDANVGYSKLIKHGVVHDASRLSVLVDFRDNAVVSINPVGAARIDELPGNAHHPARGE